MVDEFRRLPEEDIDRTTDMKLYIPYVGARLVLALNYVDAVNLLTAAVGDEALWQVAVEKPLYKVGQKLEWIEKKRTVEVISMVCAVRISIVDEGSSQIANAIWSYKVKADSDYSLVEQGDLAPWNPSRRTTAAYVTPPTRES